MVLIDACLEQFSRQGHATVSKVCLIVGPILTEIRYRNARPHLLWIH